MARQKTFMELNPSLMQTIEKIILYQHHASLLCIYVKFNKIQKEFRLGFHSNFVDCNYDNILKNCSCKLINCTGSYKQRLKQLEKLYKSLLQKIISEYPEKTYYVKSLLPTKHDKLQLEVVKQRHHKILRERMEGSHVKEVCHKIEKNL